MASPPPARPPFLTNLTSSLSALAITRLRKIKALQIQSLLSSALNHPSYHNGAFSGLVNVNTPSQTTLALLMASPHLSDEEKRTIIQPLRRAIGHMDDGSTRQDFPSDEEDCVLPVHMALFIGSVGLGFAAEWVMGVADEIARDRGYESAEQCMMGVSRVGGQVRQVMGGNETVEEGGNLDRSQAVKGPGEVLALRARDEEKAAQVESDAESEREDEAEKAEQAEQRAPRSSQAGRDEGGFGPDFTENVRKNGFRF
jgi:hypothetical protein